MSFSTTESTMGVLTASMAPKFAVSYLRVSTRGQAERGGGADEGFSIPAQREANKKKALSMGAIVAKEFVDQGASAKSADRPQLQKMLEYVKENADRVDYIIVHKVDRLARNRGDDIDIMRTLRECGVQLVSASESIDDTPAGMLLHGIMSSIAEFYSQNLATEVKKGMTEKAQRGGTISRAPLGYKNIHRVDDKGREERTVIIDEERAPLIKLAFEEYATGNWTVEDLAEHLAACGLTTRATPNIPSAPIDRKALYKVLSNRYYTGILSFKGVEYPGIHPALISMDVWQRAQDVLASHINGERTREHPHFLKGSLYCKNCGSRMFINYTKSGSGVRYPYFVCGGRHNKVTSCKQKAVLISEVERQVEQIYDRYSFPPTVREYLENFLQDGVKSEQQKYEAELDGLRREKDKLERKRKKLLEAHYNDAIPLDLLKSEQQKIAKQLAATEREIKTREGAFESVMERLSEALELMEDCGKTYRLATDHIKRMMNQAIFSKLWVEADGHVTPQFAPLFETILKPAQVIADAFKQEKTRGAEAPTGFFSVISNRIQKFFGCCWSNDLLVPVVGLEPTRYRYQRILSPSRLPIPSHRLISFYYTRSPRKIQEGLFEIPQEFQIPQHPRETRNPRPPGTLLPDSDPVLLRQGRHATGKNRPIQWFSAMPTIVLPPVLQREATAGTYRITDLFQHRNLCHVHRPVFPGTAADLSSGRVQRRIEGGIEQQRRVLLNGNKIRCLEMGIDHQIAHQAAGIRTVFQRLANVCKHQPFFPHAVPAYMRQTLNTSGGGAGTQIQPLGDKGIDLFRVDILQGNMTHKKEIADNLRRAVQGANTGAGIADD